MQEVSVASAGISSEDVRPPVDRRRQVPDVAPQIDLGRRHRRVAEEPLHRPDRTARIESVRRCGMAQCVWRPGHTCPTHGVRHQLGDIPCRQRVPVDGAQYRPPPAAVPLEQPSGRSARSASNCGVILVPCRPALGRWTGRNGFRRSDGGILPVVGAGNARSGRRSPTGAPASATVRSLSGRFERGHRPAVRAHSAV